jgi:hypothetical protein
MYNVRSCSLYTISKAIVFVPQLVPKSRLTNKVKIRAKPYPVSWVVVHYGGVNVG